MRPRTVETGTYAALGLALVLFLAGTLYSLARLSDQREADARVDHADLTALLYFQGYSAAEMVRA